MQLMIENEFIAIIIKLVYISFINHQKSKKLFALTL